MWQAEVVSNPMSIEHGEGLDRVQGASRRAPGEGAYAALIQIWGPE